MESSNNNFAERAGLPHADAITPAPSLPGTTHPVQSRPIDDLDVFDLEPNVARLRANSNDRRKEGSPKRDVLKANKGERVYGYDGHDRLTSHQGKGGNHLFGGPGRDTLLGGRGDRLYGNADKDFLSSLKGKGKNRLSGGADNDHLLAKRKDRLLGNGGRDYLDASQGNGKNNLKGGAGEDLLIARTRDRLHGGSGADIIWSGNGKNRLKGGKGRDQFWIVDGRLPQHRNIIKDFKIGTDFLGISVSNDIRRFSDLDLVQQGKHTLIQFEGKDIALLKNVQAAALDFKDFLFDPVFIPQLEGAQTTTKVTLVSRAAKFQNEMGIFFTDDAQGRIGDVMPGDPEYAAQALSKDRRITAFRPDDPDGTEVSVNLQPNQFLGWYLIQDGTIEDLIATNPANRLGHDPVAFFSFKDANPDGIGHLQYRSNIGPATELAWEDLTGGGDRSFDDLVFKVDFSIVDGGPAISVGNAEVTETDGEPLIASIPVTLARKSEESVSVEYRTIDGTAEANSDYEAVNGTLIFAPGETSKIIEVPILGDLVDEPKDEQFEVILQNSKNGILLDSTGTITISDNDSRPPIPELPTLSVQDTTVVEGSGNQRFAVFDVTLSKIPQQSVTVEFSSVEGTATADEDYQSTQGTLMFAPGAALQQQIRVPILDDDRDEADEQFEVVLGNAVNAEILDGEAIATIQDDDEPTLPQLSVADVTVIEGNEGDEPQKAIFTVSLSAAPEEVVTVEFATVNGTAIEPADYEALTGQLTFNPGEPLTQTVEVTIVGDSLTELEETFGLELSNPVNAEVVDGMAVATIIDDEQPDVVTLLEERNFEVVHEHPLVIPETSAILEFTYGNLAFDRSDTGFINDAFEVALVDENGNSLVHTIGASSDAFFNITEGQDVAIAPGVEVDGETVRVNLTGITPGIPAKLIFRLVNDDGDTNSAVQILNIGLTPGDGMLPPAVVVPARAASPSALDQGLELDALEDVTSSLTVEYGQTSFNPENQVLSVGITLDNEGIYSIHGPLVVAIANLSDPSVQVVGSDGTTPEGLPYFDASAQVENTLDPTEQTDTIALTFNNPNGVQFTYDVVVLARTNLNPVITSSPDLEIIGGQTYEYQVVATDEERDAFSYELVVAPDGMVIDESTGLLTWITQEDDIANHSVVVRVADGLGGIAEQSYTLAVIAEPSNRPPIFTSTPVVDAYINQPYNYDADAVDPDQDPVTYGLVRGPEGLTVDETTGVVEWTPPPVLSLGDMVLGQISLPGEQAEFTLNGVTGQKLFWDGLKTFPEQETTLYSPTGKVVSGSNGLLTLTETGTYRVVVGADGSQTGSYGFTVIDPALLPETELDTVIEGQLSPGTETDLYRFTGSKGQKIFVNHLSHSGNLDWALFNTGDQILNKDTSIQDIELELQHDGEYILALRGQGAFTDILSYSFEIVTPDHITRSLTLDTNELPNAITGAISEPGEEDIFTFTGTAGQTIFLDRLNFIDNAGLHVILKSPSGLELLNGPTFVSGHEVRPLTLTEDKVYELRVNGTEDSTGAYHFSLRDVGLAPEVNLDQTYTDTLEPGESSHLYRFEVTAGQRIFIDYQDDAGNQVEDRTRWVLYDEDNQPIASEVDKTFMEEDLEFSGTYTLTIEGNREDVPVAYSFEVITPDTITRSLSFDSPVSHAIAEKGERHLFRFEATQGQRILLDVLEPASHRLMLTTPSGQALLGVEEGEPVQEFIYADGFIFENSRGRDSARRGGAFILPESGTYELLVDGYEGGTGAYGFQLIDVSSAPSIPFESVVSETLDPGMSIQVYQFEGQKGDRIFLDDSSASQSLYSHIYGPGNQQLGRSTFNRFGNNVLDQEHVLPGDGIYYVLIRGESDVPVDFTIQLYKTITIPEAIALNIPITGSISKIGQQNAHTFEGTAGQRILFDGLVSTGSLNVTLNSPSGDEVHSGAIDGDSRQLVLSEAGTYTITVDGTATATGSYEFVIRDEVEAIALNTPVTDTLRGNTSMMLEFDGVVGQRLSFESLDAFGVAMPSANASTRWTLYGPDHQYINSETLATNFTELLEANGSYLLVLNNSADTDATYRIQINDVSSPLVTPSGLNQTYTGTISIDDEIYPITGNAGTLLYIDGVQGDSRDLRLSLSNPSGRRLLGSAAVSDNRGPFLLKETGDYQITVEGQNQATGDYEFKVIALGPTTPILPLNQVISTTVEPQETTIYRFTGSKGQQLLLDGINASTTGINIRVIAPDARVVVFPFSNGSSSNSLSIQSNSVIQTLPIDGEYYVLIDSSSPDTQTAQFQLLSWSDATTIAPDTFNRGNFGISQKETVLYKFTGTEGQRLYVERTLGGTRPGLDFRSGNTYSLYGPEGERLFFQYLIGDEELEALPTDGEYVLALFGNGDAENNYEFQIVFPIDETASLTVGDVIDGSLTKAGQRNTYTFTGSENQRILFDNLTTELESGQLYAELYSPSGQVVLARFDLSRSEPDAVHLIESGEYRLVIDGTGSSTPGYQFRVLDFSDATPVSLDTPFTDSLGVSKQETHLYRFTGEAEQTIYFDRTQGDWRNQYVLYALDGEVVFDHRLDRDLRNITLPTDGDYILAIVGTGQDNANYQLNLVTPDISTNAYAVGDTISGRISEPGEIDRYTFTGDVGQMLWFDSLLASENIVGTISSPSGATYDWTKIFVTRDLGEQQGYYEPFILREAGTYTISVTDVGDQVGDYEFRLLDFADAIPLELDKPVSGTFGERGTESTVYTFNLEAGQPLYIRHLSGQAGSHALFNKEGHRIFYQDLADRELGTEDIEASGTYFFVLSGYNTPNSAYEFEIVTPEYRVTEVELGDTIQGELKDAGEQDWYTFKGEAGQQLYIDGLSGSDRAITLTLHYPSGFYDDGKKKKTETLSSRINEISEDQLKLITLDENGTYSLQLDRAGAGTGNYSFRVLDVADAKELTFGVPITDDSRVEGNGTKLYRFDVEEGDRFFIDVEGTSGDTYSLYTPSGERYQWPSSDVSGADYNDRDLVAPATGTYLLALLGKGRVDTDSTITVIRPTVVEQSLTLGDTITGELTTLGERDVYTFEGSAGQRISYDALGTDTNLYARLYSPTGQQIFQTNAEEDAQSVTLTEDGEYRLLLDGVFIGSRWDIRRYEVGAYQFVLSELDVPTVNNPGTPVSADSLPLEFGAIIDGTVDVGNSQTYSFTGELGDRIYFNSLQAGNVTTRLYAPDGTEVFGFENTGGLDRGPLTLTQAGDYRLVLEGSDAPYQFQMLDFEQGRELALNLPATGALSSGYEQVLYQFTGTAGQRLFFDSRTNSNNQWKLYGPGNQELKTEQLKNDFDHTLAIDGLYTLVIGGLVIGGQSSESLNYDFTVFAYEPSNRLDVIIPGTGENASNDGSLATFAVKVSAEDDKGGIGYQDYQIRVLPDPENRQPLITSEPVEVYGLNQQFYRYQVDALDADQDPLSYRLLDAPQGAIIDRDTGELIWAPESTNVGDRYEFTVEVDDGRGGKNTQSFEVEAHSNLGTIQGVVWDDLNGNGYRDTNLVQGDNPELLFIVDVSGSAGNRTVDWTTTNLEDLNLDNLSILDIQQATVLALTEHLVEVGRSDTTLGIMYFSSPRTQGAGFIDMNPDVPGVQITTPIVADGVNNLPDIREALNFDGDGGTDFTLPLETSKSWINSVAGSKNLIFLSDGFGALEPDIVTELNELDVNINAFGIGQNPGMAQLQKISPDAVQLVRPEDAISLFRGWDDRFSNEPLMENVTVYLDLNNNSQLDSDEPWQVTQPDDTDSLILTSTGVQFSLALLHK